MSRRLVVRPEAQLDAEEAAFWYDHQQPGLGNRFTDELGQLLLRISQQPLHFPEIDRETRRGLLNRFPYSVYFAIGEETVTVVAVLHQRRRPGVWKLRL